MNIYIYSDESGVFDYIHNRWYIFGGVILLSKKEKELAVRKYIHAEKVVRAKESLEKETEVKASKVSNKDKHSLFARRADPPRNGGDHFHHRCFDSISSRIKNIMSHIIAAR